MTLAQGVAHGGGASAASPQAELLVDGGEVALDGADAEHEVRRDLLVRLPRRDHAEDLRLPVGQSVLPGGALPGERNSPCFWRSAKADELRARRLPLERRAVSVVQRLVGAGHEHAHARRLVRSAQLLPEPESLAQRLKRLVRAAVREQDRASSVRRRRGQARGAVGARDLGELLARCARVLDVSGGEGDLDRGREQARSRERIAFLRGERALDRRGRALGSPLGEAEQRQARLGIPAPAVRSPKRLLGSGQVAPLSPQVAELVVRLRDDAT